MYDPEQYTCRTEVMAYQEKKIGNHKFEIKYVIIQHNILTITLSPMFCPNTNDPLDGLMEDLKKKKK